MSAEKKDILQVISAFQALFPDGEVRQLQTLHVADDNGFGFFDAVQ
jgi:hypothetical protein